MRTGFVALVAFTAMAWAATPAAAGWIERLYVLDCGQNTGRDQSRWSPGVNEGKAIEFSNNCYLVKHTHGLLLWDTGVPDAVASMPNGMVVAGGAITYRRAKTLAAQLAELGVRPADITYLALSHTHGDHTGNLGLFPASTVLIQKAEYDWAMAGPSKPAFAATQRIDLLPGDADVFGDGSVVILTMPGHTPGHQALFLRMPKTGPLILSGDAVHFRDNWVNRRVPSMNMNREQTLQSLDRIANIMQQQPSQLWIGHDKAQSAGLRYSPAYYE